jgi:hypothetical protein
MTSSGQQGPSGQNASTQPDDQQEDLVALDDRQPGRFHCAEHGAQPGELARAHGLTAHRGGREVGALGEDGLDHQLHEFGLAGHIAVEGHRRDVEFGSDLGHRHGLQALGVSQGHRGLGDPPGREAGVGAESGLTQPAVSRELVTR